ncbi:MAG: hypothetical protein IPJ98_22010 [Bryobacterales bacterium]|nr:hypothetical protein [Bryobacterales bacterium]
MEFLSLGYCAWDYLGIVPHVPRDGKVRMKEHIEQGGGPAATAAVTAARLGVSAGFAGKVGDDDRGRYILAELRREGVDTSACIVEAGAQSAAAFCWVEEGSGNRSIAWHTGTATPMTADDVPADAVRAARILHLDGNQPEAALAAALCAREAGVLVSLDAGTFRPHMARLLELSDIVVASEQFSRELLGRDDPEQAVREMSTRGPRTAVVTMGSRGCLGLAAEAGIRVPAYRLDAVDTTGAGDVYHGAFCAAILAGWDVERAMRFASAAAAIKCTRLGGRTGIPSYAEVCAFLDQREA